MKTYSTGQVVKIVGIDRITLWRWLQAGKIKEPRRIRGGGIDARIWTARDVERVRRYKAAHYMKKPRKKRKA